MKQYREIFDVTAPTTEKLFVQLEAQLSEPRTPLDKIVIVWKPSVPVGGGYDDRPPYYRARVFCKPIKPKGVSE